MSRSIKFAFSLTFAGRLGVAITAAVTTALLTRILGPERYGEYGTVIAIFGLFQILMSAGITTGSKKFFSENRPIEEWKSYVWGYYTRLSTLLAALFASSLIASVHLGFVEWWFGPEYIPYFYLLAALSFAIQYSDYVNRVLMGLQLERYSEPLKIVRRILYGVIGVGLAVLGYGVSGVLIGQIIAGFLVSILGLMILQPRLDLSTAFKKIPSSVPTQELRSFQNSSIIFVFLLTSLYHVDVLMLQQSVSEAKIGYYKAALILTEFLWIAPRALQGVMLQSVSDLWRQEKIQEITSIAKRSTRYILLFTLLCSIGLAALSAEFIPFYFGDEYQPAIIPLLILLPGTLGFAATRPVLTITQAKGEFKPLIIATGVAAIINIGLNGALIPIYGLKGAAVATSIGYGSLLFTQYWAARTLGYQPYDRTDLLRIASSAGISAPLILSISHYINGFMSLIVVPPLGAGIFVLASVITGALRVQEIEEFKNIVNGILST